MNGSTDKLAEFAAEALCAGERPIALLQLPGGLSDPIVARFGHIVGGPVTVGEDFKVTVPYDLPVPADVYMVIRTKLRVLCWFGPRRVSMGETLMVDLKTALR